MWFPGRILLRSHGIWLYVVVFQLYLFTLRKTYAFWSLYLLLFVLRRMSHGRAWNIENNCWTSCPTMLGPMSVILILWRSGNFVVSEHTNITRFFVAYSESLSVLIVHVGDLTVQIHYFSERQTLTKFTSMKQSPIQRARLSQFAVKIVLVLILL